MNARQIVMLGVVAATRGSSFMFMAIALKSFAPLVIVFFQFLLATLALGGAALYAGKLGSALSSLWHKPGPALAFALTQTILPFLLISLGQQVVPSGLAAILLATAPLFVALLAPLLDRSEVVRPAQGGGLIVGLLGVVLVVGVGKVSTHTQVLGIGALLGAAASYALSGFIMKRSYHSTPVITMTFLSLLIGLPLFLPFALMPGAYSQVSASSILTLVILSLLNTALPLAVYIQLLREVGAGRALLMTYLSPVVALILSVVFLHEGITAWDVLGLALILGSVTVVARQAPVALASGKK